MPSYTIDEFRSSFRSSCSRVACSAGGFSGFHLYLRVLSRHFGFAGDWENWGENARMSEGVGAGKEK